MVSENNKITVVVRSVVSVADFLYCVMITCSCFSNIQIGFTFLVLAHPGSPGRRAIKRVCVCVCVHACMRACVCICNDDSVISDLCSFP